MSTSSGSAQTVQERDSEYEAYEQDVDRASKTFENPNEWANFIPALGKLAKVFQSNAKFGTIPNRVTVAKRLSQCLHPALPMGVHLKALETHRIIFEILGENLASHLYLFALDLFPLMDHCEYMVKSKLLDLFEKYVEPLVEDLRGAIPSFLACVFSAMENETEFGERCFDILEKVSKQIGQRELYLHIWKAVSSTPSARLPALYYVNEKLAGVKSSDARFYLVGADKYNMLSAIESAAEDVGSPLLQQCLLDFILLTLPLNSTHLTDQDFVQLLRRCLFVVLRRDTSINSRMYQWLTNRSDETTGVSDLSLGGPDERLDLSFFQERALGLIRKALEERLQLDTIEIPIPYTERFRWIERTEDKQVQFVRVCRLLQYILEDRPDIGKAILEVILPKFLQNAAKYHKIDDKIREKRRKKLENEERLDLRTSSAETDDDEMEEIIQTRRFYELSNTFNTLLDLLDPGLLWTFLVDWYKRIAKNFGKNNTIVTQIHDFSQAVSECLDLCKSSANIRKIQLPKLLKEVLCSLSSENVLTSCHQDDILALHNMCQRFVQLIKMKSINRKLRSVVQLAQEAIWFKLRQIYERMAFEHEGSQIDACLGQCFAALSTVAKIHAKNQSATFESLIDAATSLVDAFLDVPIYHVEGELDNEGAETPKWLKNIGAMIDGSGWLREVRASQCANLPVRASLRKLLCDPLVLPVTTARSSIQFIQEVSKLAPGTDDEETNAESSSEEAARFNNEVERERETSRRTEAPSRKRSMGEDEKNDRDAKRQRLVGLTATDMTEVADVSVVQQPIPSAVDQSHATGSSSCADVIVIDESPVQQAGNPQKYLDAWAAESFIYYQLKVISRSNMPEAARGNDSENSITPIMNRTKILLKRAKEEHNLKSAGKGGVVSQFVFQYTDVFISDIHLYMEYAYDAAVKTRNCDPIIMAMNSIYTVLKRDVNQGQFFVEICRRCQKIAFIVQEDWVKDLLQENGIQLAEQQVIENPKFSLKWPQGMNYGSMLAQMRDGSAISTSQNPPAKVETPETAPGSSSRQQQRR